MCSMPDQHPGDYHTLIGLNSTLDGSEAPLRPMVGRLVVKFEPSLAGFVYRRDADIP